MALVCVGNIGYVNTTPDESVLSGDVSFTIALRFKITSRSGSVALVTRNNSALFLLQSGTSGTDVIATIKSSSQASDKFSASANQWYTLVATYNSSTNVSRYRWYNADTGDSVRDTGDYSSVGTVAGSSGRWYIGGGGHHAGRSGGRWPCGAGF